MDCLLSVEYNWSIQGRCQIKRVDYVYLLKRFGKNFEAHEANKLIRAT